jgi:hypothetical protein
MNDQVAIPDHNLAVSERLKSNRDEFIKNDSKVIVSQVREMLGITFPKAKVIAEKTGFLKMRNYDIIKYQVMCEGEFPVPAVVCYPEITSAQSKVVLYLNEGGKDEILADESTVGKFISQGDILVVADLRGFGETLDPLYLNDAKYWNREYRNAMISMHIGKPIMGQRVTDIQSLLDFTTGDSVLKGHPVQIIANGDYGPAVVHATFLDKRIQKVEISGSIRSFNDFLRNTMQKDVYSNVLYGVLKYYDLPDLASLSGKGRIQYTD